MNHGGSEWVQYEEDGASPSDYYAGQDQQRDSYSAQPSWETSNDEPDEPEEYYGISNDGPSYSQPWAPQSPIEHTPSRHSNINDMRRNVYRVTEVEEHSCQTCGRTFTRRSDRDRHFQTVHVDDGERNYKCDVGDCAAGVTSWRRPEGLRTHNKTWHSYCCEEPGCSRGYPRGFRSQDALDAHNEANHLQYQSEYTSYKPPNEPPYEIASSRPDPVHTNQPSMSIPVPPETQISVGSHAMADKLDPRYKVQPSSFFVPGRVFKVLWSEPTNVTEDIDFDEEQVGGRVAYDEYVYTTVRRFVVIRTFSGHSQCLPILTYGGQGVLKRGIHAETHAQIYSSHKPPRVSYEEMEKGLTRKPIRIRPESQSENLDPMSRLNYAKIYTIEHNIKVLSVGRVTNTDGQTLVNDFDDIHRPLADTWGLPLNSQQSQRPDTWGLPLNSQQSPARREYSQPSSPQEQAAYYNVDTTVTGLESMSVSQNSYNYNPSYQAASSSYNQGSKDYENSSYFNPGPTASGDEAIPIAEVPRRPQTSHEKQRRRDRRR
ncbi:hypothetical protein BDZ45DRAFT_694311 [Acephala macrosclerotiorum]|nr:hypothetical protein BDZ45DRAFT_694311 [Acephala macrosclerotiorum]